MQTFIRIVTRVMLSAMALCAVDVAPADGQAVVAAWGNVDGVRVDGEVIPIETSLCTVDAAGRVRARSGKERQQPRFARAGNRRTITTRLGGFTIVEVVEDVRPGEVRLDIRFTADSATDARGAVCVALRRAQYDGPIMIIDSAARSRSIAGGAWMPTRGATARDSMPGVSFHGGSGSLRRRMEIRSSAPLDVSANFADRSGLDTIRIRVPVTTAPSVAGASASVSVVLRASGDADHRPVTLALDARKAGRAYDGLGGNFRIQNPAVDAKVIAYNLANLRVAWARVEMPWRAWHPDTMVDPSAKDTSQLDQRVRAAMEIARTLARKGAPVIVSAWFPPQWAAVGPLPRGGQRVNGMWGNQLDQSRMPQIYASLTSYLLYLKKHYGVEAVMFSFNESDLGIDVRQTPQEHAELIKGLGAYMKSKGLATTMLLGDVSDATPVGFIAPAMKDATTWPYIGAVSYHSWRGWSDSLLTFWSDAAKRIGVPLLVGEGSTDAGAWRYPAIFLESDFALPEIELYVRMLALSEPKSILQWQLTSDYSLLAGGGVYGDSSALRPTQRFWNLKQLASTPEGVAHLRIRCGVAVSCAALGNAVAGRYAVHVVNTGASRMATLTGLPRSVTSLRLWVTDATRAMREGARVRVVGGRAQFALDAASYVTVMAGDGGGR